MTVRREQRGKESRLIIDIPYQTADGKSHRYRRDAQVQTKTAAEAEHRRLIAELAQTGTLNRSPRSPKKETAPKQSTFADAAERFKTVKLPTLKPSTRITYADRLNALLLPRFGDLPLEEITGESLARLDADLAKERRASSTRRNFQILMRSILRVALDAGLMTSLPKFPPLPSVKRKVMTPLRREHVDAILAVAAPSARLAFALGAFAGLRSGEIRGLRWSDIDLEVGTVTIRSSISRGVESSPKSGNQDVLPLTPFLQSLLKAAQPKTGGTWVNVSIQTRERPWSESGLYKAFRKTRAAAGFEHWTLHDLRHFFVSELFRQHVPAPFTQALARHSALTTTQRYADVDANDLREAVSHLDGNGVAMKKSDVSTSQPNVPIS